MALIKRGSKKTFPPTNPDSLSELCKLVYRLRGVNERKLEQLAQNSPAKDPGDAIRQTGDLVNLNRVEVPVRLQEYLGFDSVYFLQVKANKEAFRIITSRIPKNETGRPDSGHRYPADTKNRLGDGNHRLGYCRLVCQT